MSTPINDGGPAFPGWDDGTKQPDGTVHEGPIHGMSLRAWFAGQAIAGLATDGEIPHDAAAELAVKYADKLIHLLSLPKD